MNDFRVFLKQDTMVAVGNKIFYLRDGQTVKISDKELSSNKWFMEAIFSGELRAVS
ncbi:MAG: hypothetical protein HC907_35145 [Richelia sp. SM1_7_0]|nr:hypothetical protein [Richelia sp. SM1_7_0]